jgi:hypothetical protein
MTTCIAGGSPDFIVTIRYKPHVLFTHAYMYLHTFDDDDDDEHATIPGEAMRVSTTAAPCATHTRLRQREDRYM